MLCSTHLVPRQCKDAVQVEVFHWVGEARHTHHGAPAKVACSHIDIQTRTHKLTGSQVSCAVRWVGCLAGATCAPVLRLLFSGSLKTRCMAVCGAHSRRTVELYNSASPTGHHHSNTRRMGKKASEQPSCHSFRPRPRPCGCPCPCRIPPTHLRRGPRAAWQT